MDGTELRGAFDARVEGIPSRGICTGGRYKLKEGRFRLDVRKTLLGMRVVRHRNRLPREVGNAPSPGLFKARLDGAFSNML